MSSRRPFLVLGLLLAGWLLVPPLVRALFRASFFELQAPVLAAAGRVRDIQDYWALRLHTRRDLIAAGVEVGRDRAAHEAAAGRAWAAEEEVRRLEAALRLPLPPGFRPEVARVERRDLTGWWQQLVVRKGDRHGIRIGAPVIFAGGVVGRVREVHAYLSTVELLSSSGFRLSVVVEGDAEGSPLAYRGDGARSFAAPAGWVHFVPAGPATLMGAAPRRLLTSGLGGVFPAGLVVGSTGVPQPDEDGLLQAAPVVLDPRLTALREVVILVPLDTAER